MRRFFRSAAFPILIVIVLAFFAQRLISPPSSEKTPTFNDLRARNPASLEVCALLTKPDRRRVELPIRYVGFEIPNRYVIGYGLDYAQRYRNLSYVAALNEQHQ